MPIIDLQRRLTEAGRIRLGDKGPKGNPRKLETFRLTSSDEALLEAAAQIYGGDVTPWNEQGGQYQVTTEANALNVIVPPSGMAFSQWYETWSGGGCLKRCDGEWDTVNDRACSCDPTARECTPHTRLSVILPDLPSMGVWRLETQGYWAASELSAQVELCQRLATAGQMVPARLRLEQRVSKKLGQPTKRFVVPVLDPAQTYAELLAAASLARSEEAPALTSGGLRPVPVDELPEAPVRSIAAQVETRAPRPKRANAATPIPPTNLRPRTGAQFDGASPAGETPSGAIGSSTPAPAEPIASDTEADTVKRAQGVARALRECVCEDWPEGILGDLRPLFLDAYSLGEYSSAKEIPEASYASVRDAIRKVKLGELRFVVEDGKEPVLRTAKNGLVWSPLEDKLPASEELSTGEEPF